MFCLWCCHRNKVTVRVHPVHLANVGQRHAAADPQTKPTDSGPLSQKSAGHMQNSITKTNTNPSPDLTDTGGAVLTLMLGYRSLYITWQ